jgi:hypothetical protein
VYLFTEIEKDVDVAKYERICLKVNKTKIFFGATKKIFFYVAYG